jgi:LIVCS family branched-chain amino acid:cation transporter
MTNLKRILVFGFALFAGFFGAGNLILPPLLGLKSGPDWWLVALGFLTTTTVIPLLSLFGHARLQGTLLDFAKKVSPKFSLWYCIILFFIVVVFPIPRTAAVTHEMAVAPLLGTSALLTSCIYFGLILLFVVNRSTALNVLGKYLTPIIVSMVLLIIGIGLFSVPTTMEPSVFSTPVAEGFLEGYQTYDALAGMVMGGVIIISLNAQGFKSYAEKKAIIAKSGAIAMLGLFIIYIGLIALGAQYNGAFPADISRTDLLLGLSETTLGHIGAAFIGVLIALACFTTAVAIVVSIGDFFKAVFKGSQRVYFITVVLCCLTGIVIGSYEVRLIIDLAYPALLLIYPMSIALIVLNLLSDSWASRRVFRFVILTVLLFSIPDAAMVVFPEDLISPIRAQIPLSSYSLGWVLPALLVFIGVNGYQRLSV